MAPALWVVIYHPGPGITEAKDLRFSAQGKAGDENAAGPVVAYRIWLVVWNMVYFP